MATQIQRNILNKIHKSPNFAIMVDKTTDCSNKEQLTFLIRSVDEDIEVQKIFLACTIYQALQLALLFQLEQMLL